MFGGVGAKVGLVEIDFEEMRASSYGGLGYLALDDPPPPAYTNVLPCSMYKYLACSITSNALYF